MAAPHRQPLALHRPRVVSLGGHYRGGNDKHDAPASGDTGASHSLARRAGDTSGVEDHIVYVAQLDNGTHITLTPAEFAQRFAWKNDPEQATLLGK